MKIRKIISAALICAVLGGALPCADISADETDWKTLYEDTLYEYMEATSYYKYSRFSLNDINGDNIPELIISEDSVHMAQCLVYTIYNDELLYLGKYGAYGFLGYYSDLDVITQYNIGQGYEFTSFSRLENGEVNLLCSFENNLGAAPTDEDIYYKVNGSEVTKEEYNAALDEYKGESFVSLGQDYKFSEQSIKNAISGNYNWRELYREKLYEFKQSEDYSEDYMFDLYDINGDNIPELFISNWYSPAEIYTVYEGQLTSLGTVGDVNSTTSVYYRPDLGEIEVYTPVNVSFMKLDKTKLTVTDEFVKISEGYEHNGEILSRLEYYDTFDSASNIVIGRKYNFGDAAVEYALRADDKLTSMHRAIYIYKLFQLKAEFGHEGDDYEPIDDAQFELCDLNGDGYAELAFSPSVSYAGGACSIFSAGNRKLVDYGYLGVYGDFKYNAESNLVYRLNNRMGLTYGEFYKLGREKWKQVISYNKRNEDYVDEHKSMGIDDDYEYKLNGKEVSRDKYYSAVEKYENEENSVTCGRRSTLTVGGIAETFFGGDSLVPGIKTVFCAIEGAGYMCR